MEMNGLSNKVRGWPVGVGGSRGQAGPAWCNHWPIQLIAVWHGTSLDDADGQKLNRPGCNLWQSSRIQHKLMEAPWSWGRPEG